MADKAKENSVFTKEEEVFIVEQFVHLKSPTLVKRAFRKQYGMTRRLQEIHVKRFSEVYQRFQKNGLSPKKQSPRKGMDFSDSEKISAITDFFLENPFASLNDASKELKIPKSTISWYLKKKIKMTPYKMSLGQTLLAAHKAGRLNFCQWLLSQPTPPDFVQLIVFGDEKWFHLTQHPNRQNTRYWAFTNPHMTIDTKVQGCAKVQAFVCVCDGKVLPVIWHVDEEGKNISVNTDRYCEAIDEIVKHLPKRKIKKLWWQQDGAPCHTSHKSLNKLKGIFGDRIISNNFETKWPSRSPDLNPLDYSFWGMAMKEVWDKHPKSIDELKTVVETFFSSLSEDLVRRTVANILKRAELCINMTENFSLKALVMLSQSFSD